MSAPAYRCDGRPVSRQDFYALACDPQRSVVVQACAGAGKTWMLVSRILRCLLEGAQPHDILAITFTRKAAGEMRERLDDWLREFAAPSATHALRVQALVDRGVAPAQAEAWAGGLQTLHARLLGSGRSVEIRTFHAWFSQLLRCAPLELLAEIGLQPEMTLLEDMEDHRAAVFRRFHAAVLRDPALRADHSALTAERGRSQLLKWLQAAWDKRVEIELADEAGVLEGSVPDVAPLPGHSVHEPPVQVIRGASWRDRLGALAGALGAASAKPAQAAAAALVQALALDDAQRCFDQVWEALYTQAGTPRKHLDKIAGVAAAQDALRDLDERIRQRHAHTEHLRMVRLSRVLLREYARYKRERALCDMSDLERCGLALLRDATLAGWVQERLDAHTRHLLIDEFQDTSPLQWHALHAWLGAYAGVGGGASGQQPPGVFIVGDPKQSIYRFRRAEPRVFEAAQDFVVQALQGHMLACDHTRRNAPQVLAPLNALFESAQREGAFDGFRVHTTELPDADGAGVFLLPRVMRPDAVGRERGSPVREWRDSLSVPRLQPDEVLREREAAEVAQAVSRLIIEEGWDPDEIFVLSRKRQSLRLVAQALQQRHVPWAASEEQPLMASAQARDLVAVLDVLVSPHHALSLAQALRSPLFGASDADLVALACAADGAPWWSALTGAPWPDRPVLARAAALLQRWQASAAHLPPHDLLDRIVHDGELRQRVAATVPPEQGAEALQAIDAVLAQSLTLDGARYATPYSFVRALRRRAIPVAGAARGGAVQLLTVHGAKGLEASVVFVMDATPQAQPPQTATLLVDWPVQAPHPVRCAFVYAENACPPALRGVLALELQARAREELNGLYVAMSRAKQRLVFSATEAFRGSDERSWWSRVEALARPWPQTPAPGGTLSAAERTVTLAQLTPWVQAASLQGETPRPQARAPRARDAAAAALGQAVHRVLEWVTPVGQAASLHGWAQDGADLQGLAQAAAAEFGVAPAQVLERVGAILHSPACAPFFKGPQWLWAGNEVAMVHAGADLRIDRLVCLRGADGPQWWVLDYKLHHAPDELDACVAQLGRYGAAVRAAQPDARVRCAFVTGAGALIEVEPPESA